MEAGPTFIIIGAARAGTTGLYTYLKQHPQVFMSPHKETNFFSYEGCALDYQGPGRDYVNNSITELADYQRIFAEAGGARARGEASPLYLYEPQTPERIKAHLPEAKLIAILRNPVEQVYSHFLYARRQMIEPLEDIAAALDAEEERVAARWQPVFHYARFPRYFEQLSRYRAAFPEEQLRVYLYEDFEADPLSVLSDIFAFIDVDPSFRPDVSYRPNAGGNPRNHALQSLVMEPSLATKAAAAVLPMEWRARIRDAISAWNMKREVCPPAVRARLLSQLRDDIESLQGLIGRDLSAWLA